MNQEAIVEQVDSAPLYSFVGYLLDNIKEGKTLHLTMWDTLNNIFIDDDIINRDDCDSIVFKIKGKIKCADITTCVSDGYKLKIEII